VLQQTRSSNAQTGERAVRECSQPQVNGSTQDITKRSAKVSNLQLFHKYSGWKMNWRRIWLNRNQKMWNFRAKLLNWSTKRRNCNRIWWDCNAESENSNSQSEQNMNMN